ncbi:MAG: glycosyltransferase family 2 protein [Candidatus Doudnabacteria bacterium]|nr:glycosyltransferase family 2 protein [Candidatus Doudnabacteria bacterium]
MNNFFQNKYSIGVVTYIKRFDTYFVPLVKQLEKVFPKVEKNYILNGYYDEGLQKEYLQKATEFLKTIKANAVVTHLSHQPLARCWNQLILVSKAEKVLILNDDLEIYWPFKWFFNAQVGLFDSATVNRSWSHFFISKSTVKKIGWFDERLAGNGMEDGDYAMRMALYYKQTEMPHSHLHNIYCLGVKNIIAGNPDPGWKGNFKLANNRFAKENEDFFNKKWQPQKSALPGSVHFMQVYCKLNQEFGTPVYYPFSELNTAQDSGKISTFKF